jgi:hypothetical protein
MNIRTRGKYTLFLNLDSRSVRHGSDWRRQWSRLVDLCRSLQRDGL